MVAAIDYRAMALQHHRWAGMCRSPESREEHFRLEKELLTLADSEERLHGVRAPEQASNPQQSKIAPRQKGHARRRAGSRSDTREDKND
jgi:hypothetical protein